MCYNSSLGYVLISFLKIVKNFAYLIKEASLKYVDFENFIDLKGKLVLKQIHIHENLKKVMKLDPLFLSKHP